MTGTSFAVWAPNARGVRVVGDFNHWDGAAHPMRSLGSTGVWELFVPGRRRRHPLQVRDPRRRTAYWRQKADPMARATETPPATASVVTSRRTNGTTTTGWPAGESDPHNGPMTIYEVHLGSWRRRSGLPAAGRPADRVRAGVRVHARRAPAGGRAPLRAVVGVPGHRLLRADRPVRLPRRLPLPGRPAAPGRHRRDPRLGAGALPPRRLRARAVRRQALYEHPDPRRGDQPDWGTYVFDFGRRQVRNFLVANALLLVRGVPRRRPAGRRGRLDALPGLLPRGRAVAAEQLRRPREPRGGAVPPGDQRHGLQARARRGDDRRGVHRVAGRDPADPPGRPGLRPEVEHGLDARLAGVHAAASRSTGSGTTTR